MAEQRADGLMRGVGTLKRRGLLAGAAALAASGVAKLTGPGHAEAANTTPEDVLHADATNTTIGQTDILSTGSTVWALHVHSTAATHTFQATATGGRTGARGVSNGTGGRGVWGVAGDGQSYGVLGETGGSTINASGVRGIALAGATNGVWGENIGSANSATGVFGLASATSGATVGVWGRSQSGAAGASGVYGEITAALVLAIWEPVSDDNPAH